MKDCHFPHKRRDKNLEPETVKDAICRRKRETPRRWLAFVILSYTNKAASSEFETSLGEILSQRKTKQEILTVKKKRGKKKERTSPHQAWWQDPLPSLMLHFSILAIG